MYFTLCQNSIIRRAKLVNTLILKKYVFWLNCKKCKGLYNSLHFGFTVIMERLSEPEFEHRLLGIAPKELYGAVVVPHDLAG